MATLRHYDKIGLLKPVFRTEANYRCYSIRQLAGANAIRTMQKLGVPLAEIKDLRDRRTPELAKEIFLRQFKQLDEKENNLTQEKKLLSTLFRSIQSALDADKETITIQHLPSEAIILGKPNDYSDGKNDYDALFEFYKDHLDKLSDWELSYPVWGIYSEKQIRQREWTWPDRYYFYIPSGQDQRPSALYAIGYMYSGYSMGEDLFTQMLDYIDLHGFEVCGDAYAEYPLNEVCIADDKSYLMKLMITVREK